MTALSYKGACFLGTLAALSLALWGYAEHRARARLADEHRDLLEQQQRMAALVATNEGLSRVLANARAQSIPDERSRELLRLRGRVGLLRQQAVNLEKAVDENRRARVSLEASRAAKAAATADYWPMEAWAFSGYSSPDATFQTSLWAANNGDVKTVLSSATGQLKELIEKDFAGKSETEASIRAMDEVLGLKSVRILNRESLGDDTVVLTAEMQGRGGGETEKVKLVFKKVGADWKLSEPGS